jgi:ubiquinone/menaquinone biosynthesis C-methylase UbiE
MSFDRLAPFYRAMEMITAGGKLQRCRMRFVGEIPTPRRILLAGEGHGRFLPECVRRFPSAQILVIDSSKRMLDIARRKVPSDHVEFLHGDLRDCVGPAGAFDLIVTHFVLDCFDAKDLAALVQKLATMGTPQADWLIADFEIPEKGPARWRSRVIVTLLYRFFQLATRLKANALVPPGPHLAAAGFERLQRESSDWGLLKSEWWRRVG